MIWSESCQTDRDGTTSTRERRAAPNALPFRNVEHLEGRTAVVTGAASGIGLAIVKAFAAERMRIVMADVNESQLAAEATRLAESGAQVHAVRVDVRNPESVDALGRATVERFGQLHIAVNNAGVVVTGAAWELSLDEWHRVLDVNLWGVIHGVRTFVPLILASGQEGHVVNTASMAAVYAPARLGPYAVSKHGVLALSDVLRADLKASDAPVGVSVVMPGMIRTGMNPIGSITAETVAANVVDAIRRGRPYVFTDHHHEDEVGARLEAIRAARADVVD
jgi:NAD(P)-dependent dehydrogenase (short-subunit alcohol dehydrogenase family)